MKYIKKYKVFESNITILSNIKDILSPISDDGYPIRPELLEPSSQYNDNNHQMIFIKISDVNSDDISLEPYTDELIHLNDFLEENGWVMQKDIYYSYDNFKEWLTKYTTKEGIVFLNLKYIPSDVKQRADAKLNKREINQSLFESIHPNDAIKDTIQDILSPMSDELIVVDAQPKEKRGVMIGIEIYLSKRDGMHSDRDGFHLKPYIDELNHMNDFLEDEGWVLISVPSVSDRASSIKHWTDNIEKTDNSYRSVPIFYVPKDNTILRVTSELSRDTIIDFDKKHIIFPFMKDAGNKPYPFSHLTEYHYIFFTTPKDPSRGKAVPPFIRYCKSKYGVTDDEMESVWSKYKHRMWERMIAPRF